MAIIDKPSDYFNTVLYTGDDTTNRSITGVGFKPDFTWIKSRSNAYYHELYDAVRGFSSTTNGRVLYSNTTSAEGTPNTFNSFNTDGFTVSKQTGEVGTNGTGATFVAWNWLASNAAGVSNTSGTITSTVSANTTSGFSIVSYTGTGANATVGHGLGVTPKMVIVRRRDSLGGWETYHSSVGATKYMELNSTDAPATNSTLWQDTAPTSSVFSIGTNSSVNNSGGTFIAYCFAEKQGYSKFGSYVGNGSTDGTFVYTGFKPAFVIVKRTDTIGNWVMVDSKRDTFNVCDAVVSADTSDAEYDIDVEDFLSNGFKMRDTHTTRNASGGTYIFMAFAEEPFVASNFNAATAR